MSASHFEETPIGLIPDIVELDPELKVARFTLAERDIFEDRDVPVFDPGSANRADGRIHPSAPDGCDGAARQAQDPAEATVTNAPKWRMRGVYHGAKKRDRWGETSSRAPSSVAYGDRGSLPTTPPGRHSQLPSGVARFAQTAAGFRVFFEQRCLEKNPKKRLRDIGDAWALVDEEVGIGTLQTKPRLLWPGIAAGAAVAAASLGFVHFREKPAGAPQPVRFEIYPPEHGTFGAALSAAFMVSPDVRRLAFVQTFPDPVAGYRFPRKAAPIRCGRTMGTNCSIAAERE
jgi:hypothetical protein